jgi:hypothetical protein
MQLVAMVALIATLAGVLIALLSWAWAAHARRIDRRHAEKQAAEALLAWLARRRVLWSPILKEIPEETIDSVLKIRARVDDVAGRLTEPEARRMLGIIQDACLALLDAPRGWFHGFFSTEAEAALLAFREKVRPAAENLAHAYDLAAPKWGTYSGGFEDPGVMFDVPMPRSAEPKADEGTSLDPDREE